MARAFHPASLFRAILLDRVEWTFLWEGIHRPNSTATDTRTKQTDSKTLWPHYEIDSKSNASEDGKQS